MNPTVTQVFSQGSLAYVRTSNCFFHQEKTGGKLAQLFRDGLGRERVGEWLEFRAAASQHYLVDFRTTMPCPGPVDEAIDHLRQALSLGYSDAEHLASDDDVKLPQWDSRFEAIRKQARDHPIAGVQIKKWIFCEFCEPPINTCIGKVSRNCAVRTTPIWTKWAFLQQILKCFRAGFGCGQVVDFQPRHLLAMPEND